MKDGLVGKFGASMPGNGVCGGKSRTLWQMEENHSIYLGSVGIAVY